MSSIFSAGGLDELKNHARSAWKAGIGERNANKRRLLGPFEAGAEVTVSAWTFDERVGAKWSREKFGCGGANTPIAGVYVSPCDDVAGLPCAFFCGSAPAMTLRNASQRRPCLRT